MKILVAGLRDYKSGKTTLTLSLMRFFTEKDISVCGFKPKSGNNLWYHWKNIKKALEEGTLYGTDAIALHEEMERKVPITLINPVHRLWMPNSDKINFGGLPNFILDRLTLDNEQIIAINNHIKSPVDDKYFKKLISHSKIMDIQNREDLQKLTPLYEKADKSAEKKLLEEFDIVICESYANTGLPWDGINEIDYVFVIEPFYLRIYDGERYLEASRLVSTIRIEQTTQEIVEPIKPLKSVKIPPFSEKIIDEFKKYLEPQIQDLFYDFL
ncbi:MAG: hypothetical protein ACQERB_11660 [Promethearchaeati archaeon]